MNDAIAKGCCRNIARLGVSDGKVSIVSGAIGFCLKLITQLYQVPFKIILEGGHIAARPFAKSSSSP